jgi:uncharacterized protein YndB with AHSA1/START domain
MKRTQLQLEFMLKASPTIVYTFLTNPACIVRWFCDSVDIEGDFYKFGWGKTEEWAELVDDIEDELLRFSFDYAESDEEFLEFRIYTSEITEQTILEIKEWCDENELADQKLYWESAVATMKREMGG